MNAPDYCSFNDAEMSLHTVCVTIMHLIVVLQSASVSLFLSYLC